MTQEEILAMQPGHELNAKVAEKIMGQVITKDEYFGYMKRSNSVKDGSSVWSAVEPYSQDISAAELVVDKMIERGFADATNWANFGEGRYTEAEAICKSALLAIL